MFPRNLSRMLASSLALVILSLITSAPARKALAAPDTTKGFCASDSSGPVVYVSNIFDAITKAKGGISTQPLNNAFYYHLIELYDYKNRANYPTNCTVFETLSQAEGRRSQLVSEAQKGNKRVVEVNWNPSPVVAVPMGDGVAIGPNKPPTTHTICALGHESTMYFSAVFDTDGYQPSPKWNDAFNDFLRKNYAAEGEANCTTMNTAREAEQLLKDRTAGVRAQNHKAVETGWRYNASVAITRPAPKPTPKVDDDAEPTAQRTPAAVAPKSARDFATAEVPAALAICQNDRMMSGAFDCYCLQREVYNYRMAHASDAGAPEPLADLFAKDKLNSVGCIGQFVAMWARSHAQSQSLTLPVAECVSQRFTTELRAKPYPSQVKTLFNAAIAACKK